MPDGVAVVGVSLPSGERRNGPSSLATFATPGDLGVAELALALRLAALPLVLRRREAGTGPENGSPNDEGEGEPSTLVAIGAAGAALPPLIGMGCARLEPTLLATLAGRAREAAKSRAGGEAVLASEVRCERRAIADGCVGTNGEVGEEGGGGGETMFFRSRSRSRSGGGGDRVSNERRGEVVVLCTALGAELCGTGDVATGD